MDEFIFYYPKGHEAHFEPGHPERPERVEAIRQSLDAAGWWQKYPKIEPTGDFDDCLASVHTPEYLSDLKAASAKGRHLDMDTYTTPASWQIAYHTAGGAAAVASAVWKGQAQTGFALTRPPGHHATPSRGMGFCLLNNVAVAAEYLLQKEKAQRLAIVDLDLHHGNGTQEVFWRSPAVLYISTHQYPHYPGTGRMEDRGAGNGLGTTANIPFPPMSGDRAFQAAMEQLIIPLLDRYQPQMILVSIGFDAHWRDPLGYLLLSAKTQGNLISKLKAWAGQYCGGKIALFLEGGYDLEAGAACAQACVAALTGQDWQDPIGPSPKEEGSAWIPVVRQARTLWEL
ncbi:MAG: histone deacetylase [Omnitrophica WOR_2 bacterium]